MKNLTVFFSVIFFIIFTGVRLNSFAQSADTYLETKLNSKVQQAFTDLQIPGVIIGVWMGDRAPWITTMGVSNLLTGKPISVDDKMRIGSITKTFTGTVILQLQDEGKLNISDKLSKYFPDYPNGDNITLEELGNMTSGLFNYSEDDTFGNDMMQNMKKSFTPEQLIAISQKHAPYFAPGTGMHYSNTNTILLGLIAEKITGNTLQAEIQNRILTPLGMTNSNFAMNADFPDPHAQGYMYMDSTNIVPTDVTDSDPSWGWAAGSMISTLGDVKKYAKKLATGGLISAKSQEERLKWGKVFVPATGGWANADLRYAFAIADFEGAYGHNGGIPGFNSFMGYDPVLDATIIVLVNMQDNKNGVGPADSIAHVILNTLKGK
ncbi:MAG: serine hydrolase domain-containing protein [bacterium]